MGRKEWWLRESGVAVMVVEGGGGEDRRALVLSARVKVARRCMQGVPQERAEQSFVLHARVAEARRARKHRRRGTGTRVGTGKSFGKIRTSNSRELMVVRWYARVRRVSVARFGEFRRSSATSHLATFICCRNEAGASSTGGAHKGSRAVSAPVTLGN